MNVRAILPKPRRSMTRSVLPILRQNGHSRSSSAISATSSVRPFSRWWRRRPTTPLTEALDECQRALLALKTILFEVPTIDFTKPISAKEQLDVNRDLRSREYLFAREEEVTRKLIDAIGNLRAEVITALPEIDDALFRVPLIALIKNPLDFLDRVIATFLRTELIELGLFGKLNNTIYDNMAAFSDITDPATSKKPMIWPSDSELSGEEAVDTYFSGTPLHSLLLLPCPLAIPFEQRFSGHWIIAPPGRGKTTLLHTMVLNDLDEDAAIIVIDSKGDLLEPIKRLDWIKDRLLLIEASADYAFALNPLDVSRSNVMQVVSMIEYIMAGLLDAKFTALQSTLFRHAVPAIIETFETPTLETFKTVMIGGLPATLLPRLSPHTRAFFDNRATGFYSKTYESTRKEIVWRLDYLMTNPIIRQMFSASRTKLDIGREMDAGKVILINNSKAALTDEGAEFFGRFFIALIVRAAQQRTELAPEAKKPCYVYIDECQSVIAKDTRVPTLLDECRSQNIGLILAHQRTAQLSAPVLDAVANCAIRMANSDDEAKFLADKIRMSADSLRSLPRGTFGTFIRDFSPPGFTLKVPRYDVAKLPRMTDEEFAALRERMRATFAEMPQDRTAQATTSTTVTSKSPSPAAEKTPDGDPGEPAGTW